MFTKLRNKFLILNMSITSMVIILAFAIIYLITYNNIHSEIQNKLNSRSEMQISIEGTDLPENKEKEKGRSAVRQFSLEDPETFNIEVDAKGNILSIDSFIDMSQDIYEKAAKMAWKNKNNQSTITLDGKQWKYKVTTIKMQIIGENGQQYTSKQDKFIIVFLNITASQKTLFQLLTTLVIVAFITLIVIFFISLYFANRSIKPIAQAWEKQKQFVADASHELKTPLSIINANYDALMVNQEDTIKNQIKWLNYMRIGTDRMAKLVNDLLSLAKVEDVNFETQKVSFNISSTINNLISSMEAPILDKGIEISSSIEPEIVITNDAEKIKQAITILMENAIKYTNKNGTIEISLKKLKRQVIFSIKNSGKGIVRQDLPKVFDRFYRADPSRTQEMGGYGLGLSIAKTIIDRLGGEIRVVSVENSYTIFTFTLNTH